MRERISQQIPIERKRFYQDTARPPPGSNPMKTEGPTPVPKMLSPERAKCQGVGVANYGLPGIRHTVAVGEPAITELTVFCGSTRKGRIKAADGTEAGRCQGQVVRGEETRSGRIDIVVAVQIINKVLTRAGIWIIRKRIDRPTAYDTIGILGKADSEGLEPIGGRPTIVVSESEEGSSCSPRPGIPCSRRTGVRLSEQRRVKLVTEGSNHLVWTGLTAIIHHDRLEAVPGIVQMSESLHAADEVPWAIVRRDNDREHRLFLSHEPLTRILRHPIHDARALESAIQRPRLHSLKAKLDVVETPCNVVERVGFRSNTPNRPKSSWAAAVANVTLHANHSIRSRRSHGVT